MGPDLDQARFSGVPTKIIICSTGRSGSWMLCRYMINNGLGIPGEYFNRNHIAPIARRLGVERSEDIEWKSKGRIRRWVAKKKGKNPAADFIGKYIEALMQFRVFNGIFSAKLLRNQYNDFFQNGLNCGWLQGAVFVYLYRQDVISQAVSLYMARQNGRWDFTDDVLTTPSRVPRYDNYEEIERNVYEVLTLNAEWTAFFTTRGIDPVMIEYKNFLENPNQFLKEIANRAGIEPSLLPLTYREAFERNATPVGVPSREEIISGFRRRMEHPLPAT